MAKKEAPQDAGEGAPAGKSRLKLIIIVVVALLLVIGASVGATWFLLGGKGDKKADAAKEEVAAAEGETQAAKKKEAIYQFIAPAFVVNFNHAGRQRFMQVSVTLMGRDATQMEALNVHMPLIRNRLVMLFSSQDFANLLMPVGKEMLRQQATATVQELAKKEIGELVIEQVLFTNFVLQ